MDKDDLSNYWPILNLIKITERVVKLRTICLYQTSFYKTTQAYGGDQG